MKPIQNFDTSYLKPCPFCGQVLADFPDFMVFETKKQKINPDKVAVHCIHCGATGPKAESYERAAMGWNDRMIEKALKGKDE